MEKIHSRPSLGGGKYGGGEDMTKYLERMGRQLAEMEAQHLQFFANRPTQDKNMVSLKAAASGHNLMPGPTTVQQSSVSFSDGRSFEHTPGGGSTVVTSPRDLSAAHASQPSNTPSGAQPSARRSLTFHDGSTADGGPLQSVTGASPSTSGAPAGSSAASHGTPPPHPTLASGGNRRRATADDALSAAAAERAAAKARAIVQAYSQVAQRQSTATSSENSAAQSPAAGAISAGSASPQKQLPPWTPTKSEATESPYSVATSASPRPAYTSPNQGSVQSAYTANSSPVGVYVAYDASRSPAQPPSTGSRPSTAQPAPQARRSSRLDQAASASAHSPMTPSDEEGTSGLSAAAVHNYQDGTPGELSTSGLVYPLAGQRFDGIDSEDDDDDVNGVPHVHRAHDTPTHQIRPSGSRQGGQPNSSLPLQWPLAPQHRHHGQDVDQDGQEDDESSVMEEPAALSVAASMHGPGSTLAPDDWASPRQPQRSSRASQPSAAPVSQPRGLRKTNLSTSSLEQDEELLRLLQSSIDAGHVGDVGRSVEIPEEVLQALAAADPNALDKVLVAAAGGAPARPGTQGATGGSVAAAQGSRRRSSGCGHDPQVGGSGWLAAGSLPGRGQQAPHNAAPASGQPTASSQASGSPGDLHPEVSMLSGSVLRGSVTSTAYVVQAQRQPALYGMRTGMGLGGTLAMSEHGGHGQPAHATDAGAASSERLSAPLPPSHSRPPTASPDRASMASSFVRGDGDTVLFGSPSRKGYPADLPGSHPPSPYIPPSPPLGANPSPYSRAPLHSNAAAASPSRVEASLADGGQQWRSHANMYDSLMPAGSDAEHQELRQSTNSLSQTAPSKSYTALLDQLPPSLLPPGKPDVTHSSFSMTNLQSPSGGNGSEDVASHDLAIDEAGLPLPRWRQASRPSLNAEDLPVTAFSRAAAAAAAADVAAGPASSRTSKHAAPSAGRLQPWADPQQQQHDGQVGPASVSEQQRQGRANRQGPSAASTPSRDAGAAASGDGTTASSGEPAHQRSAERVPPRAEGAARQASGHLAATLPPQAPEKQPAVSPVGASTSLAKLSQLKARRQQHWQEALQPQSGEHNLRSDPHPGSTTQQAHGTRGNTATAWGEASPGAGQAPQAAPLDTAIIPHAVAQAIVRATSSSLASSGQPQAAPSATGSIAAGGELSLGHGITGLTVAIESDQVKWAWNPNGTNAGLATPPSGSSPWSSPGAGYGGAGMSTGGAAPAVDQSTASAGPAPFMSNATMHLGCGNVAAHGTSAGAPLDGNNTMPSGGAVARNKAAALMRLKQQSINRHTSSLVANPIQGPEVLQPPQAGQQVPQQPKAPPPAVASSVSSSRSSSMSIRPGNMVRHNAAPGSPGAGAYGGGRLEHVVEEGEDQDHNSSLPPKTFLKRRTSKVPAQKVDWSHVKSRTNSRNEDYYPPQQPYPVAKPPNLRVLSPAASPKGMAGRAANGKGWKPGSKLPMSPTEDEKHAAGPARRSRIPAFNYEVQRVTSTYHQSADRHASKAERGDASSGHRYGSGNGNGRAIGATRGSAAPDGSPLDDLLHHVNGLLKDFDKLMGKGA